MSARKHRLLILGGTEEAAKLASLLAQAARGIDIITSLAGRTENPQSVPGTLRIGGFGGSDGLAAYLKEQGIAAVVDATHPFATAIAANADEACIAAGVPLLRLARPAWRKHEDDRWIDVADAAAAAAILPQIGRRAFLTVGSRGLAAFGGMPDIWFLVRLIDAPKSALPLDSYNIGLGRGPFTLEGERALLTEYKIDVVIAKASGGGATEAKLIAAREAKIPVILLRRPSKEDGETVDTPQAALEWVRARLT